MPTKETPPVLVLPTTNLTFAVEPPPITATGSTMSELIVINDVEAPLVKNNS